MGQALRNSEEGFTNLGRFVLTCLVTLSLITLPSFVVQADSYFVTSVDDNTTSDSNCTLREAIRAANDNSANDDCGAASPGDDTITFITSGTIELGAQLPRIEDARNVGKLTIDAEGAITVSGQDNVGVFHVAGGGELVLENIIVSNGNVESGEGGGLLNLGTVTVRKSIFSNNTADRGGAIDNFFADLTVENSTFSGNEAIDFDDSASDVGGGAIANVGSTTTITNSRFANNATEGDGGAIYNNSGTVNVSKGTFDENNRGIFGGAISNHDTLTITTSTFVDNASLNGGGGLRNSSDGTATVKNSTFSSNSGGEASGGGLWNSGSVSITHTSFVQNTSKTGGAGLDNSGSISIKNSIVADSTQSDNCSGSLDALGVNFDTDGSCTGFTQVTSAELNLGALANNIPGTNATHALSPGSVAIDASTDCADVDGSNVTADQRGVSRPQGEACDAGAYEADPEHDLIAEENGNGGGTVTDDRGQIDCGSLCISTYGHGAVVALTATPSANSTFAGWSGDCSGMETETTVTLDAAKTCTATFNLKQRTLTVTKTGNGTGTITSEPIGIDCGDACQQSFADGMEVTLTAAPGDESEFAGWSGDCTGNDKTVTITMDADKACEAAFNVDVTPGDSNDDGQVQVMDARLCLQIALGIVSGSTKEHVACDVDGDGDVDNMDAKELARATIGLSSGLTSVGMIVGLSLLLMGLPRRLHPRQAFRWRLRLLIPLLVGMSVVLTACPGLIPGLPEAATGLEAQVKPTEKTIAIEAQNMPNGGLATLASTAGSAGLTFNADAIRVTAIDVADGWTLLAQKIDNTHGQLLFAAVEPSEGTTNGRILTVRYERKGERQGTTNIDWHKQNLTLGDTTNVEITDYETATINRPSNDDAIHPDPNDE